MAHRIQGNKDRNDVKQCHLKMLKVKWRRMEENKEGKKKKWKRQKR